MKIMKYPTFDEIEKACVRPRANNISQVVRSILDEVKREGDSALYRLTEEFDGVALQSLTVGEKEIADVTVDKTFAEAITCAYKNIFTFHKAQLREDIVVSTMPGIECTQCSVSIQRVGLYVPGGSAPLFSSLLMLGVPALIAGVTEIVVCTPPQRDGKLAKELLYTAKILGIKKIFSIGGAQAIAAMAYGTETVPQVDKIFGPGNQFVTAAKIAVLTEGIAIDLPAGPSEVAVIAGEESNPSFIAWDLLSQAEHGVDSQILFVTWSEAILNEVNYKIAEILKTLPRKEVASEALKNSVAVLVRNSDEAFEVVNTYAPEHLILNLPNAAEYVPKITSAGSVFLGPFTPESLGDYASGTNHVLPTGGSARAWSGVSVESFQKKITFQSATKEGLRALGLNVMTLAFAEGLAAHAGAVQVRLDTFENGVPL